MVLLVLCCRGANATAPAALIGRSWPSATAGSLMGILALTAHRRSEQILAGVQIMLAAHHGAGRLQHILGSHALPVLVHVVVARLVAKSAVLLRAAIFELVRDHLVSIGLVTWREARDSIIAGLHAHVRSEVNALAAHFTPSITRVGEHRRLGLLHLPVIFGE